MLASINKFRVLMQDNFATNFKRKIVYLRIEWNFPNPQARVPIVKLFPLVFLDRRLSWSLHLFNKPAVRKVNAIAPHLLPAIWSSRLFLVTSFFALLSRCSLKVQLRSNVMPRTLELGSCFSVRSPIFTFNFLSAWWLLRWKQLTTVLERLSFRRHLE